MLFFSTILVVTISTVVRKVCSIVLPLSFVVYFACGCTLMLSEYVSQKMREKALTRDEVIQRARRQGRRISSSYLAQILNDQHGVLGVESAEALAEGLGVPLMDVVNAALGRTPPPSDPLLDGIVVLYQRMNTEQRQEIEPFLKILVRECEFTLFKKEPQQNSKQAPRKIT
jgi:transcriptional regulator with XRE-family HTH domain